MRLRNTLSVLIGLMASACGKHYEVSDGQVQLTGWNEGVGSYQRIIAEADAASFQELEFDCDCSFAFGRDKDHVFVDGVRMDGIDPSTFEYMGNYLFRDRSAAYFLGFYNDLNDTRIDSIDPSTITLLEYPWARSGDRLIHGRQWVVVDDLENLQVLDRNWARTGRQVLFKATIVEGADPASFSVTDEYKGRDKSHSYENGRMIR